MLDELNHVFSAVAQKLENLPGADLTRFSQLLITTGAMLGLSTVRTLDEAYTAWTLAGAMTGAAIALSWRSKDEQTRVVAGRAGFALASGVVLPPVADHFFPWISELTKNATVLYGVGIICAMLGFTLGHWIFAFIQKREGKIGAALIKRVTSFQIDGEEEVSKEEPK